MEITKVVKPFITRGANTFGNIVYLQNKESPSGLEAHERNKCRHNDNFFGELWSLWDPLSVSHEIKRI